MGHRDGFASPEKHGREYPHRRKGAVRGHDPASQESKGDLGCYKRSGSGELFEERDPF